MLVVCATTVHRVGLQTAPNELCPRVPLMAWNTCAFTIQAIGTAKLGLLCHAVPFHVFRNSKTYVCMSSQKTYCRKRASHSLGPYKTDRLDATYKLANSCHIMHVIYIGFRLTLSYMFLCSSILACRFEGNCSVFSSSET